MAIAGKQKMFPMEKNVHKGEIMTETKTIKHGVASRLARKILQHLTFSLEGNLHCFFSASCWWKRDHYYTVNKRIVTLARVMINKWTLIQCSRGNYSHIFIQKWIDWARVKISILCYTLTGQDNDSLSASCRLVSPRESPSLEMSPRESPSLEMSPRESSFLVPLSAEPGESPFHSGLYARGMNIVWM